MRHCWSALVAVLVVVTISAKSFAVDPAPTAIGSLDALELTSEASGGMVPSTLMSRISDLEDRWQEFDKAEQQAKDAAAGRPTMQIGGRVHADFWSFTDESEGIDFFEHSDPTDPAFGTDPEDRFTFRRVRLEMRGDVLESMQWRIQVDFNNPGTPEIKDVFLGFKNLPGNQQLLIGNQKRPIGLDHLNSSRFNVFTERPFVVEAFNEDARRPGICVYGNSDDETWHWRYGAYYLENISRDGRVIGDSRQMSLNARLAASPWYDETSGGRSYFHWAIAGVAAHPDGDAGAADTHSNEGRFRTRPEARSASRWLDTGRISGADWYEILALECLFNAGPLQITAEYQHSWMQRDFGGPDLQFHGGYVYAAYFLTGEHIPYNRRSGTLGRLRPFENFFLVDRCGGGTGRGWGAWAVAARYSYLDLSDADIAGGVGESFTLGVNWHWTAYSRMQFNLIYGDIHNHADVGGFTSGDYLIAGTRLLIDF